MEELCVLNGFVARKHHWFLALPLALLYLYDWDRVLAKNWPVNLGCEDLVSAKMDPTWSHGSWLPAGKHVQFAMENGPFIEDLPIKMVISHSCVIQVTKGYRFLGIVCPFRENCHGLTMTGIEEMCWCLDQHSYFPHFLISMSSRCCAWVLVWSLFVFRKSISQSNIAI